MAGYLGVLMILGVAALLACGLWLIHRWLSGGTSRPGEELSRPVPHARSVRSLAATRIRAGFLVGALLCVVTTAGVTALVPWAIVVREIGGVGLLGFVLLVLPPAIGLLHAASQGPLEW